MTTTEIANRLVELCKVGQFDQCYYELFSDDAAGYEMEGLPNRVVSGKDNLLAKSAEFAADMAEMHDFSITSPIVMGNHFAVGMMIDLTKKSGGRQKAEEICVYEVKDGKIISERFIYSMP